MRCGAVRCGAVLCGTEAEMPNCVSTDDENGRPTPIVLIKHLNSVFQIRSLVDQNTQTCISAAAARRKYREVPVSLVDVGISNSNIDR